MPPKRKRAEISADAGGYGEKYVTETDSVDKRLLVIGPAPAGIGKLHDIFRFVFYIKYEKYDKLIEIRMSWKHRYRECSLKTKACR